MQLNLGQVKKLLEFGGSTGIKQTVLNTALTRLRRTYEEDPCQETLEKCTGEINGILGRFSSILGDDFNLISKIIGN